jgi:hypothetical protein
LSGQVYALCEERRQNLADNERLCAENSELQRLNIALRCDIEKYQQLIGNDFDSQQLMKRVEELQDILI